MYIFAKNAKEIVDSTKIEKNEHVRYKINSQAYSNGVGYDYKFNSALLNGFLHKVSLRMQELIINDSKNIRELDVSTKSRYNSKDEINNINYSDNTNYIKKMYLENFISNRLQPYYLTLHDKFSLNTKEYITQNASIAGIGLVFGVDLPLNGSGIYKANTTHYNLKNINTIIEFKYLEEMKDKAYLIKILQGQFIAENKEIKALETKIKFPADFMYKPLGVTSSKTLKTIDIIPTDYDIEMIIKNREIIYYSGNTSDILEQSS